MLGRDQDVHRVVLCCCVAVAMLLLLMVLTSDASSVAGLVVEARAGAVRSVFIVSVP